MNKSHGLNRMLKRKEFSLLIVLILVMIFFGIMTHGKFFKPLNIRNILNAMVIVAFLTIGEGMLIIYGNIDLSAGTVGTLSAIVMAHGVTTFGLPWWIAVIMAVCMGLITGFINATLITRLHFQPFIATLAMKSICEGLADVFGNASAVKIENKALSWIGNYKFANNIIPVAVIIALLFMLVYGIILAKTKFGRKIYLCGGNRQAAFLAGISPVKMCYVLFMNMGALAALAGCMLAARVSSATVTGVNSNQFSGVTAAILGGISFGGGSGGMAGAFIGLLLLNCFNNGMTLIGLDPYWQTVASGALLLLALIIDYYNTRGKARGRS